MVCLNFAERAGTRTAALNEFRLLVGVQVFEQQIDRFGCVGGADPAAICSAVCGVADNALSTFAWNSSTVAGGLLARLDAGLVIGVDVDQAARRSPTARS